MTPFKYFLLLLAIALIGSASQADVNVCSQYVGTDKRMSQAVSFLQSIEGTFQLGDCSVELHVCHSIADNAEPGTIVGDLLVKNAKGEERYVQLEFLDANSGKLNVEIQNGSRLFHYESDDRFGSKEFGQTESVRLEFLKSRDQKNLVSLEVGWYSTKDWKARQRGSVYRWTLCRGVFANQSRGSEMRLLTLLLAAFASFNLVGCTPKNSNSSTPPLEKQLSNNSPDTSGGKDNHGPAKSHCLRRTCGDNMLLSLSKSQLQSIYDKMRVAADTKSPIDSRSLHEGMVLGAELKKIFPNLDLREEKTNSMVIWIFEKFDQALKDDTGINSLDSQLSDLRNG